MQTFETFLLNTVGSAELIASEEHLRKKWIDKESGITSAFDYSELATQVLDDLDIENETERFKEQLEKAGALDAVREFTRRFVAVDKAFESDPSLQDPLKLLKSKQWAMLRKAACVLASLPAAQKFLPSDRDRA